MAVHDYAEHSLAPECAVVGVENSSHREQRENSLHTLEPVLST